MGGGDGGGLPGGLGGLGRGEIGGGFGEGICSSPAWMIQLIVASLPRSRVKLRPERTGWGSDRRNQTRGQAHSRCVAAHVPPNPIQPRVIPTALTSIDPGRSRPLHSIRRQQHPSSKGAPPFA